MNQEAALAAQEAQVAYGAQVVRSRRPKITLETVNSIADLVVKQLNETEACKIVGINPKVWDNWKRRHRNSMEFDGALTRLRARFIQGRMNTIQAAEAKDWRAADRLLQIVAPERFGHSGNQSVAVVAIMPENVLVSAMKRVYGASASASALPETSSKRLGSDSDNGADVKTIDV
jgi:hypothetical protein